MGKLVNVKFLSFADVFSYFGSRYQLKGIEYNVSQGSAVRLHVVDLGRNRTSTLETTTACNVYLVHKGN